jgi:hypothetical protein
MKRDTNVVSSYYYKVTGLQIFRESNCRTEDSIVFEYEFILIPADTKWNYL